MALFRIEEGGRRADALAASVTGLSRTEAARLLEEGKLLVNGLPASKKQILHAGDELTVPEEEPAETDVLPENIPLDVVYQDSDLAVINKPRGMVVHPAQGNRNGTLVNAALFCFHDLSGINGELRPGIVHRLDKDTSGLIVIAKNDAAHASLARQFQEHTNEKRYLAVARGVFHKEKLLVENCIGRSPRDRKKMAVVDGGKFASTEFRVLEQYEDAALVECLLHTGRTHQIRVHLAGLGHPCLGDPVYGHAREDIAGQALHSWRLALNQPTTGERLRFEAPLPEDMIALIKKVDKNGTSRYNTVN